MSAWNSAVRGGAVSASARGDGIPEWKTRAPVVKNRVPAPKKLPGSGGCVVVPPQNEGPRLVKINESPYAPPDPDREYEIASSLANEAYDSVVMAEEKVAEAMDAGAPIVDNAQDLPPEEALAIAQDTEKKVAAAEEAVKNATRIVNQKSNDMGDSETAMQIKNSAEFYQLHTKYKSLKNATDKLRAAVAHVGRRVTAEKKAKEQKEVFEKYDLDGDGFLNPEEVAFFAKGEYNFEPTSEQIENIFGHFGSDEAGVPPEKLQRLRALVAIQKGQSLARDREMRKAEMDEVVSEVGRVIKTAEATSAKAKESAEKLESQVLLQLRAAVENVETEISTCKGQIVSAEALTAKAMALLEADGDAQDDADNASQRQVLAESEVQITQINASLENLSGFLERARKRFKQVAIAENEVMRIQAAYAVRGAMEAQNKTGEQLFEGAGDNAPSLSLEQFTAFIKSLSDLCPPRRCSLVKFLHQDAMDTTKVEGLYKHLTGAKEVLNVERFVRLLTRLRYCVAKETAFTEDKVTNTDAKLIRKFEIGEMVEALDDEEANGVKFVRCRDAKNDVEGWAMVSDSQGTTFLEPCSAFYLCVKETILTGALNIMDGRTVRRIAKGEIIEALDSERKDDSSGITRIQCKSQRDGKTGWASVCGNTGITFLMRLH